MKLARPLAAAAVLASLVGTAPAQAATPTPSQQAKTAVGEVARDVHAFADAHEGTLPTQKQGNDIVNKLLPPSKDSTTSALYAPNAKADGFCVVGLDARMTGPKMWYYDSGLDREFLATPKAVRGSDGVCAEIVQAYEAAAYQATTMADARMVATMIEADANDAGMYPKTLAGVNKLGIALTKGDTLSIYRYVPASADAAAGFQLCVTHVKGAWASYDSLKGGIVAKGTSGKKCAGIKH